jgi:hypothetical protein
MTGTHTQHEDFPWMIAIVDHPPRRDSARYTRSRTLMRKIVATTADWILAGSDYQDHHGGSVWVLDGDGWLCLQLPLGIEWSAQFCADPAKVDRLRRYAARVVAAFPRTLAGYESFGYHDGAALLETPVSDSAGVAAWTDSIFNASLPLPARVHTGVLPKGAGYHHYPKPIVDIDHFRYDDFTLFVTDGSGLPAVVVPVSPRGSGDGRVRLLGVHPDSDYVPRLTGARRRRAGRPAGGVAVAPAADLDLLDAGDPLARQAFARQT